VGNLTGDRQLLFLTGRVALGRSRLGRAPPSPLTPDSWQKSWSARRAAHHLVAEKQAPEPRYCTVMASTGQTSTQLSQSVQVSWSTTAMSSFIEMASTGQASTQDSHPVHVSESTTVGIDYISLGTKPN
jgi:hypothetical protein